MKIKSTKILTVLAMVSFFVSCGTAPKTRTIPLSVSQKSSSLPKQKPYRSLKDASKGLAEWESFFAKKNEPQAAFFASHCETARTLTTWIRDAKFNDNASTLRHTVAFAEECRKGLYAHYSGSAAPKAWSYFAEEGRAKDTDIATSLLLGINAHINRDLPYTIINAGIDPTSQSSWEDHQTTLDALMEASPRLRAEITKRYLPSKIWINDLFGWYIDQKVRRVFTVSRNRAWNNAARLKSALTKSEREKIELEIEQQSIHIAQQIIALKGKYARQLSAIACPK